MLKVFTLVLLCLTQPLVLAPDSTQHLQSYTPPNNGGYGGGTSQGQTTGGSGSRLFAPVGSVL